jgi:hypothetical protein
MKHEYTNFYIRVFVKVFVDGPFHRHYMILSRKPVTFNLKPEAFIDG